MAHDNDVKESLRTAIINATEHLQFSDNWVNEETAFSFLTGPECSCLKGQRNRTLSCGRARIYAFLLSRWSGR